ncbi:MAG: assimilatory sulfite reductase (NADPH) flavoprotein subunit [Gloeobacteraceae cyanobacterium ES-bin-144]|nr:assimilatory sulfite reductase (NADPH) flavoprotein subunit [Verrucomicrobiales bacterium]
MLPEHAPFHTNQRQALDSLLSGLDSVQRAWLSGFLASAQTAGNAVPAPVVSARGKLTVLYGTESGNSETLADRAVKQAKKIGFQAVMKNMSDVSAADVAKFQNLFVIVSTWGDGEPPEAAVTFFQDFMTSAVSLSGVRFSVCALGDTSYEKFCQSGKDIDARLEALGASRIANRQDCDLDYEEPFTTWLAGALTALAPSAAPPSETTSASHVPAAVEYGKKYPFPSEVLDVALLNGEGSAKETLHLELSLAGSGLSYEPGDSIAVLPVNAADIVQLILTASKLKGSEEIEVKGVGRKRLTDALREDYDITALSRNVLTKLAETSGSASLKVLLADDAKEKLKEYVDGREIVDAIEDYAPAGLSAEALTSIFRKLPPRLYSIASSPLAHPDEVHLTVAAVRYHTHNRSRKGVCSTYLADQVKPGDLTSLFVQPNKNFRLPADGSVPIIMVGPGTGIAPFRAFVEHRAALGSSGENWLFMGDQHYLYDFLYQLEWQEHLKTGALTRLDVAFSRDQPEKIYVQHRMQQYSKELYAWLEKGAYIYVCGDATHMAADVHQVLINVVQEQAGISREAAEVYVEDLKKTKRYQRDVY